MDPGLLLLCLAAPPVFDGPSALALPGVAGPLLLPVEALSPPARAAAARTWPGLGLTQRVVWLLEAGDEPSAAVVVRSWAGPWPADLPPVLGAWSGRIAADLGLPAGGRPITVLGGGLPEAALAYEDVAALLPLPVRWTGPVVVVLGNGPLPGLPPGDTHFARPACPLLRLPAPPAQPRAEIAGRLVPLVLALQAPPAGGWPPWLVQGLTRVVAATAAGRGPSPKAMLDRRANAGLQALRATLEASAETVDPALAEALATALVAPWRRATLPAVLERLRAGASSEAALAGGTGTTLADLCVQR